MLFIIYLYESVIHHANQYFSSFSFVLQLLAVHYLQILLAHVFEHLTSFLGNSSGFLLTWLYWKLLFPEFLPYMISSLRLMKLKLQAICQAEMKTAATIQQRYRKCQRFVQDFWSPDSLSLSKYDLIDQP